MLRIGILDWSREQSARDKRPIAFVGGIYRMTSSWCFVGMILLLIIYFRGWIGLSKISFLVGSC